MNERGRDDDHPGHGHGGDGSPAFQRFMIVLAVVITILVIGGAVLLKHPWPR